MSPQLIKQYIKNIQATLDEIIINSSYHLFTLLSEEREILFEH